MKSKSMITQQTLFKPSSMPWRRCVDHLQHVKHSSKHGEIVLFSGLAFLSSNPSIGGVYLIVNLVSGKGYVGSSINIIDRLKIHRGMLVKGGHWNAALQCDWRESRFAFTILALTNDGLVEAEQLWMNRLKVYDRGYNLTKLAGTTLGTPMSEEAKRKLSLAQTGKTLSIKRRANISRALKGRTPGMLGKKHSVATRRKMSKSALRRFK